jgi:hypothetical protein
MTTLIFILGISFVAKFFDWLIFDEPFKNKDL